MLTEFQQKTLQDIGGIKEQIYNFEVYFFFNYDLYIYIYIYILS